MNRLRVLLKRLIGFLGFGDRLLEWCDRCGRRTHLVWWAKQELWHEITGGTDGVSGGVLCPRCFDRECYARGKILRWVPEVAHVRGADGEWRSPFMTGSEFIEEFRKAAPNAFDDIDIEVEP